MYKAPKLTIFSLALLAAGCATAQLSSVEVPDQLRPGANESLALIAPAVGVQIYECAARKESASGYEWAFVAPEADLFDAAGTKIGHHYAGPQWESDDGSKVLGTVKNRADAPAANAIPWLLLTAKSVGPQGLLSPVTSVQRLNTAGGVAPRDGCSRVEAGTRARVHYTADYYFFTRQGIGAQDVGGIY